MKCAYVMLYSSYFLQLFLLIYADSQVFGEMATIVFTNPKYLVDFVLVSKRKNRNSRYVTSMNATIPHSWGNNVTAKVTVVDRARKTTIVAMEVKICDGLKMKIPFLSGTIRSNSDLPERCPVPAGTYHFKDFAFSLKILPFAVNSGDFNVNVVNWLTETKEKISEIVFRLRVRPS